MESKFCKVITFYSYKGGVGRSMALVNVASLLAKWGKKVLIIDWDLEAPGLHNFFEKKHIKFSKSVSETFGVTDLLLNIENQEQLNWKDCVIKILFDNVSLHMITAGKQDDNYHKKVQKLNWEKLFEDGVGNFLNDLREEWINESDYDFIFIDSRTGITDIGDVCTVLLPDILVLLFVINNQNINGINKLYERALIAHKDLPVTRGKLTVLPIPCRDEPNNEIDTADAWREKYAKEFSRFFENWLPVGVEPITALNKLSIPYVTKWSFGENIPVLESKNDLEKPGSISSAYARLSKLLAYELDWKALDGRIDTYELENTKFELTEAQLKLEESAKRIKRIYARILIVAAGFLVAVVLFFIIKKTFLKKTILDIVSETNYNYFVTSSTDSSLATMDLTQKLSLYSVYYKLDSISKERAKDNKLSLDTIIEKEIFFRLSSLYDTSSKIERNKENFSDTLILFDTSQNIASSKVVKLIGNEYLAWHKKGDLLQSYYDFEHIAITDFKSDSSGFYCVYNELNYSIFPSTKGLSDTVRNSFLADFNTDLKIVNLYPKFSIKTSKSSLKSNSPKLTSNSIPFVNETYVRTKATGDFVQVDKILVMITDAKENGIVINTYLRKANTFESKWEIDKTLNKGVFISKDKPYEFIVYDTLVKYKISFVKFISSLKGNLVTYKIEIFRKPKNTLSKALKPRIYIQIANESQRPTGNDIKRMFSKIGFITPGVENVQIVKALAPINTEVRYYKDDEMQTANEIISKLKEAFPNRYINTKAVKVPKSTTARENHFEIWLAEKF